MIFPKNNVKGFTLIELIIVFTVLAILSTAGLAAFVTYSRTQAVETERHNVVALLNLAKARAQNQVVPTGCTNLTGYIVSINSANNTYSLTADCSLDVNMSTNKVATNISISVMPDTTFVFPVLTGLISASGQISISGYGITKTIDVSANGTIN